MKYFRSALALFLVLAMLFTAVGCSGYRAVKSSKEERATVLMLGDIEVPYEMYRFYFLSELSLSGKDPSTMDAATKEAFLAEINQKTLDELAGFYAILSLCKQYGLDVEEDDFDDAVDEGVITAVEGNASTSGYGDHDSYLAALKAGNMNDSVFRTMLRSQYAEKKLAALLRDTGVIKSDRKTVTDYIKSDECVRVTWLYIPYELEESYNRTQREVIAAEAKQASDEKFFRMTHTLPPAAYTDAELEVGFYIGKYHLDLYYEALTETAFSLEVGETSDWIHAGDGMYLVRRFEKDKEYIENAANLADFTEYYLINSFYKMVAEEKARLLQQVSYTDLYATFNFDTVKMPE